MDGPSAGIAMALGIYSAIYRLPVRHNIALTGEISIHGKVKPVGGVYPKIKGAKAAGADLVIIPHENEQSLLHEVGGIEVIPVKEFKEVMELALVKDVMDDAKNKKSM